MADPFPHLPAMAISIRQPWAWAIIHAGKDIENRNWPTNFRGPVCIHASKASISKEIESYSSLRYDFADHRQTPPPWPETDALLRGGIIGTAEIVDCVGQSDSLWFFGRFGFVLANVRPVPFAPVKGALGFFDWRRNIDAGVL